MSDREPNERSEPIFVRKGLASPSPDSHEDLERLSPSAPADSVGPALSANGGQEHGEAPPAGSLLSVDLKRHTGRAWIEEQKARPPGLTAEVSATLLSRQGNLPLDGTGEDRKQTWKQIRAELEAELTPPAKGADSIEALPSWAEIKESLVREIAPPAEAEAKTENFETSASAPSPSSAPEVEPRLPLDGPTADASVSAPENSEPESPETVSPETASPETASDVTASESGRVGLFATAGLAADATSTPEAATLEADGTDAPAQDEAVETLEDRPETDAAEQAPPDLDMVAEATTEAGDEAAAPEWAASEEDKATLPLGLPVESQSAPEIQPVEEIQPAEEVQQTEELRAFDNTAPILQPLPQQKRSSPVISVALGLAALVAIGAGLWHFLGSTGDRSVEVSLDQKSPEAPAASTQPSASSQPSVAETEGTSEAILTTPPSSGETSNEPAPTQVAPGQDVSGLSEPAAQTGLPATETPAQIVEPSFDLIRIEPDGQAVIAGRAAPNTDLILLDNGQPIGTTRSNADGEWAFIPDQPLPPGDHEFAMVVNTPKGEVVLPSGPKQGPSVETAEAVPATAQDSAAEPQIAEPGGETQSAAEAPATLPATTEAVPPTASEAAPADATSASEGAPVPKSKPKTLLSSGLLLPYGIQLSSNVSRSAAEQSWQILLKRYPDLLGDKSLLIQEVTLDQGGTRYRVQTGFFEELAPARKLCQAFAKRQQDCLVFRR